jgi:hypothetical protein
MTRSDYAFLADQYPEFKLRGLTDRELDEMLEAWYAHDHYDDNPAYSWRESGEDVR